MRKLLLSMTVLAMLTACNTKKADEHGHDHAEGTHQHEDGSTHENHEETAAPQEEFTVGNDSTSTQEAHDHQHAAGEEHQH